MIKSILVPFGGGDTDTAVFASAVTLGRRFGAHLDFYHVNISGGEAAISTPHAGHAMGAALRDMLSTLQAQAEERAAKARIHFEALCSAEEIPRIATPAAMSDISADWIEENDHVKAKLVARARCRDLVIVARTHAGDEVPRDLLEVLVINCGRPVLIIPDNTPLPEPKTVVVCWKDCAEAARAVGAAIPILQRAERVVIASVQESANPYGASEVARMLEWHGVTPDILSLPRSETPVSAALAAAARRVGADLMVMGAYRRSPLREVLFGGVTQNALDGSDVAVLLVH